jgi:mannose-6-phosphate isomerase-like protein (cupin superfamily)
MNPIILKSSGADEYFFDEGCYILELSNSADDPTLSIARARLLPNTQTKLHKLINTVERYIILEGKGLVTVGELPETIVSTGDVVIIPKNCPQAIQNIGNVDLIFLAICTPRFKTENYYDKIAVL